MPQREHGDDEGRAVREQHAGVERAGSAGRGVEARERDRRRAVPHARVRIRREGGAVRVARRGEQAVEEELADAHRGDQAPQRRARAGERDGRERREREPERHDGPRRGGTAARLVEEGGHERGGGGCGEPPDHALDARRDRRRGRGGHRLRV